MTVRRVGAGVRSVDGTADDLGSDMMTWEEVRMIRLRSKVQKRCAGR